MVTKIIKTHQTCMNATKRCSGQTERRKRNSAFNEDVAVPRTCTTLLPYGSLLLCTALLGHLKVHFLIEKWPQVQLTARYGWGEANKAEPGEGEGRLRRVKHPTQLTSHREWQVDSTLYCGRICARGRTVRLSCHLSAQAGHNLAMSSRLKAKKNHLEWKRPCVQAPPPRRSHVTLHPFGWGVNKGMIYGTTGVHLSQHSQCHRSALPLAAKCAKCLRKKKALWSVGVRLPSCWPRRRWMPSET